MFFAQNKHRRFSLFPKKNGKYLGDSINTHNSWYNTKQQLFSQNKIEMVPPKVSGFCFIEYLGELIPRIISRKNNLHFPFSKRFRQLFLSVFCAKQTSKVLPFPQKQWKIFRRFHN